MNILKRELRANMKALIIWCVVLILLMVAGMQKFAALGDNGMNEIIDAMPRVFAAMFGVSPGLDLGTMEGAFGMLYIYVLIMAGVYAVLLSSGILAKEERDKTTEFLFVRPVTRDSILTQKLLAVLINSVIFDLVFWLASVIAMANADVSAGWSLHLLLMVKGVFFVQLVFIGIGTVFAASFKDAKRSGMFAILILLVTYLIYVVYGMIENAAVRLFSPFAYFLPGKIIAGGDFGWLYAVISTVICAVLIAVAYRNYRTRDLGI